MAKPQHGRRKPRVIRGKQRAILLVLVVVLPLGIWWKASASSSEHSAPVTTTTVATSTTTSTTSTTPSTTQVGGPRGTIPVVPPAADLPAGTPLTGVTVGIDPGHNGHNYLNPSFLAKQVFDGRNYKDCDTTGTATNDGYSEAAFAFEVTKYLVSDLTALGAKTVLTRTTNDGVGPCVDTRAQIINAGPSDIAIDIHADGGPATGRGFAILEPVAAGPNNAMVAPSLSFAQVLRRTFLATGMPTSTYDGVNGLAFRSDLAGLNLATQPKLLIECGNMRNATDAALLKDPSFQRSAARAMAVAMVEYLRPA
jgi:N-acetylmuramoyl-L-alanine amidase